MPWLLPSHHKHCNTDQKKGHTQLLESKSFYSTKYTSMTSPTCDCFFMSTPVFFYNLHKRVLRSYVIKKGNFSLFFLPWHSCEKKPQRSVTHLASLVQNAHPLPPEAQNLMCLLLNLNLSHSQGIHRNRRLCLYMSAFISYYWNTLRMDIALWSQ